MVMEISNRTKRNVVGAAPKFFDPLGVLSPVTILFKMFAQELCEAKVSWDEFLTGSLLEKWNCLLSSLRVSQPIVIPRCVYSITFQSAKIIHDHEAQLADVGVGQSTTGHGGAEKLSHSEDDQSYAKTSVGVKPVEDQTCGILQCITEGICCCCQPEN